MTPFRTLFLLRFLVPFRVDLCNQISDFPLVHVLVAEIPFRGLRLVPGGRVAVPYSRSSLNALDDLFPEVFRHGKGSNIVAITRLMIVLPRDTENNIAWVGILISDPQYQWAVDLLRLFLHWPFRRH